jgi:transposase
MYYSAQERLDIGRKVFNHQISKEEAAREYGVSMQSIINYVKEYMRSANIPAVPKAAEAIGDQAPDYSEMTKDQLIAEIMKKEIEVARAKKGYAVKGGGKTKEFISISDANTK